MLKEMDFLSYKKYKIMQMEKNILISQTLNTY